MQAVIRFTQQAKRTSDRRFRRHANSPACFKRSVSSLIIRSSTVSLSGTLSTSRKSGAASDITWSRRSVSIRPYTRWAMLRRVQSDAASGHTRERRSRRWRRNRGGRRNRRVSGGVWPGCDDFAKLLIRGKRPVAHRDEDVLAQNIERSGAAWIAIEIVCCFKGGVASDTSKRLAGTRCGSAAPSHQSGRAGCV